MVAWTTISEIIHEFGLAPYGDADAIRLELRRIVSELHPDRNGGDFKQESDRARFLRAREALEFMDSQESQSGALIPVSQLPVIIKAVSDAITVRPAPDIATLHSAALAESRSLRSRRFMLPKVGSSAFAALTAFLVAFGDKFASHPILGTLVASRDGQLILLILMGYSGLFFLMTWWRERRAEAISEFLVSESAIRPLFERLRYESRGRVNVRQIQEVLEEVAGLRRQSSSLFMPFGTAMDLRTMESAATLQIQRLLERRLIKRLEIADVDTWYEVQETHPSPF